MQDHLEHRLMLKTQPTHRSLYDWAIIEVDDEGHQVGEDQIPWPWTLYFQATAFETIDSTEFKGPDIEKERNDFDVVDSISIKIMMFPTNLVSDDDPWSEIHYSMFGTDRYINNFRLDVIPLKDDTKPERCFAWGLASHTYELDFRDETVNDILTFQLFVNAERFARYQAVIATGQVSRMVFRVGSVKGLYSAWSPGMSTSSIKVLTAGTQQSVIRTEGDVEPHRLGLVTDAQFSIIRKFNLGATKDGEDN